MFGTNPVAGPRQKDFLVHDIFFTVQGEGPHVGKPALFVRFADCNLRCFFCFVGSALVRMADGTAKAIRAVKEGDKVLAYDEKRGIFEPKKVLKTMRSKTDELVQVNTGIGTNYTELVTCTPEHPFLVRDRGWVEAQNLTTGDVLLHLSSAERMRVCNPMRVKEVAERMSATNRAAGRYDDGGPLGKQWRNSISGLREVVQTRMQENNPMKDPVIAAKGFLARKDRGKMSQLEQKIAEACAHLPIKFVGDGSLPINNKFPDFAVEGQNKVIEVWDSSHEFLAYRNSDWQDKRAQHFKNEGFECLFLPMLTSKASITEAVKKIADFVHNGEVVRSVKHVAFGSKAWARYAGRKDAQAEVFNLEVEDLHTYIVNGKIVHNCDTNFQGGTVYTAERLLAHIDMLHDKHPFSLVVLTGGEPMLQPLGLLMPSADRAGLRTTPRKYLFQIETAGTVWPESLKEGSLDYQIVCSPKTPKVHPSVVKHCFVWKYIVRADEFDVNDGLPNRSTQQQGQEALIYRPSYYKKEPTKIWVQPCDEQDETKNQANMQAAINAALRYGYRLSIQLHKIAGLP